MPTDKYNPDDLLTKMECCQLFCEKLRISQATYYRCYYPGIKFKSYDAVSGGLERIPFDVATAIIRLVKKGTAGLTENDPPLEVIAEFAGIDGVEV